MSEDIIRKYYYDPSSGFVGVNKLYQKIKKSHPSISIRDIKNFISKQEIYQTSKKVTGRLNSFVPHNILQEIQVDLIYIENKHLNKASYGLTAIDAFTKRATCILLKKKDEKNVIEAMKQVLSILGIPEMVYCDEGSEFTSNAFRKLMADNKIKLVFTIGHATIVERFNRTLKEQLAKYLQSTNSKTIINVLPKILDNYNNSYHVSIGMNPNEVNDTNKHIVQLNLYKHARMKIREEIKEGDKVRVKLKRKTFDKGYKPKYSKSIYKITSIEKPYYYVEGLQRGYLRAEIMKIHSVETNLEKPLLENTREGHLKNIKNIPPTQEKIDLAQQLNRELIETSVANTRAKRSVKHRDFYSSGFVLPSSIVRL